MPDDALAAHFLPPRLGLPVVHQQVAVAQRAGGAEIEDRAVYRPPKHEGGVAKRSKGDDHRLPAHGVVDQLVPHHHLDRIGANVAVEIDHLHRLEIVAARQSASAIDFKLRVVDGWDAVFGRPAGHDLVKGDRRAREVGVPL